MLLKEVLNVLLIFYKCFEFSLQKCLSLLSSLFTEIFLLKKDISTVRKQTFPLSQLKLFFLSQLNFLGENSFYSQQHEFIENQLTGKHIY